MPLYGYECKACGHADDEYIKIGHAPPVDKCPECGKLEYVKGIDLPHTDLKEFAKPIEMYSVAVNTIEEVREIQRQCPDVQISDDEDSEMFGIPIAKNRKEKLAVLKTAKFHERN